jgi:5-methylthioribose kinase
MADEDPVDLRPETATAYLEERGVFDASEALAASADALGSGVSNRVIRVRSRDRCLVLKRPLPNLAVEENWPADVSRIHNEAAAARAYAAIAREEELGDRPKEWAVSVPEVLFEDEPDHVLAIDCVPDSATEWKAELLAGNVDTDIARALGRFLGTVHRSAADRPGLRERFEDHTPFEQLRIEPYHRTTAARHPAVADAIRAETERVLDTRRTLVHGDYSPKNVLVDHPGSGRNPDEGDATLWLIDFEVAHWGDPAFDTAFMCNHLLIKSVHNRPRREAYLDAACTFWRAYDEQVTWEVERETTRELAVLMLARVDGKSPVEYAEEDTRETLREISRRALLDGIETIEGYVALVREISS